MYIYIYIHIYIANWAYQRAVATNNLDAVVAVVGDNQVPLSVYTHIPVMIACQKRPTREQRRPTVPGDYQVPLSVYTHIPVLV